MTQPLISSQKESCTLNFSKLDEVSVVVSSQHLLHAVSTLLIAHSFGIVQNTYQFSSICNGASTKSLAMDAIVELCVLRPTQ